MNKMVGILLAIIATLGLALGLQQVVSSHHETKPQTHQVAKSQTDSSQQAASSSSRTAEKAEAASSTTATDTSSNATSTETSSSTSIKPLTKSAQKSATTEAHTTTKTSRVTPVTKSKAKRTTKSQTTAPKRTVYVKVSGYKKTFYAHKLPVTSKTTVFSLLKATKLKLSYTQMPHVYVKTINGLTENDIKVGSGWKYSVNGKFIDTAADSKKVKAGDTVHWYFAVNGY